MPDEFRGASDGAKRFSDKFMPAAKRMNERGGKLMYHNHAFEFQKFDGKTVLEKISELFPNDLLNFTLDTYWVQAGGGDAVEWLKKLSGRTECIHLKDMAYDGKSAVYAPVYEGNMNYDAIISTADSLGVKHAFIEQDECYGVDPFKCLEKSLNNIMKANIR
ncbi:hypothetical protein SDC9_141883 [bioreactor metagenome]|uniref:Xylose isomerase-like TIM barrel domain-containing protein n=1 Tax=bioreactor metagenome TaxID=1076179 RepID=A0A645DZK8_9ZZZZ